MMCWLARFGPDVPCDGRLVKAHLIPKQRIKRDFPHGAWLYPDGTTDKVLLRQRVQLAPNAEGALDARWLKQDELVWDERVWVPACGGPTGIGGHHGMLDGRNLRVPRAALPEGVEAYAAEYGLTWSLDRDYGLLEAAA